MIIPLIELIHLDNRRNGKSEIIIKNVRTTGKSHFIKKGKTKLQRKTRKSQLHLFNVNVYNSYRFNQIIDQIISLIIQHVLPAIFRHLNIVWIRHGRGFGFRDFCDQNFRGEDKSSDGSGVL